MKRVRCPKCDNYIVFDETKYTEGQSLVFVCQHCRKEFGIRIGKSRLNEIHEEKHLDEQAYNKDFGSIVVVENQFAFKQVIPLDFSKMNSEDMSKVLLSINLLKPEIRVLIRFTV